jgi:hypothetical protein
VNLDQFLNPKTWLELVALGWRLAYQTYTNRPLVYFVTDPESGICYREIYTEAEGELIVLRIPFGPVIDAIRGVYEKEGN